MWQLLIREFTFGLCDAANGAVDDGGDGDGWGGEDDGLGDGAEHGDADGTGESPDRCYYSPDLVDTRDLAAAIINQRAVPCITS